MAERLHKVLAQHGLGSRREVERWIAEGRITLNGRPARTGDAYNDGDRVQLDARDITKRLESRVAMQVLAYHKPQGQPIEQGARARHEADSDVTQPDVAFGDEARETVMSRLPAVRGSRWVAINPMHPGDSGLLLFTNDGALSYALTRQKKWIPTSYMVRVHIRGGLASAPELPTRLQLDDGAVEFVQVKVVGDPIDSDGEAGNVWYQVDMARADKRAAVRALFVSHNLSISRMMQVSFGPIALTRDMPRARHVALSDTQLEQLYTLAKLPMPVQPGLLKGKFSGKPAPRRRSAISDDDAPMTLRTSAASTRPRFKQASQRGARADRDQKSERRPARSIGPRSARPGAGDAPQGARRSSPTRGRTRTRQ